MNRRGFLGSLMAVSAAVAAGVRLPSGKEVATAAPKAVAASDRLVAMLADCEVVSVTMENSIHAPPRYEVEYIHVPGEKRSEAARFLDGYTAKMRPVSFSFYEAAGQLTRVNVVWM